MFESHAQNCEDVVLWRALGHIEAGVYVDVGAADPDEDSVTKAFYERGWSGVNVEPAADYAARLRELRPRDVTAQVCAGEADGVTTLHHVLGTGLSSVVDSAAESLSDTTYEIVDVEVAVQRLDQILLDAGLDGREMHFLKIDVEGFEESVIRGIDLERWRPWVIVAEATAPRSPTLVHHSWEPLLLEHGYEFTLFDGLNRFYVANEHAELRESLSYPAGVFDQPFSTPPHAKLLREYDSLLSGNNELRAVYERALQSYDEVNGELQRSLEAYARMEALQHKTLADYEHLHAEYENALAGYDRLVAAHDDLIRHADGVTAELGSISAERDTLRHGVALMATDLDRLRDERDAARTELALTLQTLSWRVTRPIRLVRRLLAR